MDAGSSSRLTKVGIELGASTFGTASASFTHGLIVTGFSVNPKIPVAPLPDVRGFLGAQRVNKPAIDLDAALSFFLDMGDNASGNIGHFLQGLFGTDTKTGSNPYVHTFSRNDTSVPSWFNLYSDKDVTKKQYRGFRVKSVSLTLKAGEGSIGVDVSGEVMVDGALADAQSLTFSASPIVTPQEVTVVKLGGTTITNFDSITITITRDNQRFRPIGSSRYITNLYSKDFKIEVSMEGLDFAAETERDKFIANTTSSFDLTITDSAANYLTFYVPVMNYTSWDGPDVKESDLLRIKLGFVAIGNAYTVALQNARSTAYSA